MGRGDPCGGAPDCRRGAQIRRRADVCAPASKSGSTPAGRPIWRYPGDSGVPPTLDFAGSENVKSVTVLWPAPERIADGAGGHSIGYERRCRSAAAHRRPRTRPSRHRCTCKLGYAVCGNLCVPAEADLELTLSGEAGAEEPALVAAEARVPRRVSLGAGSALAVRSVHREPGGAHERVVVEVAAPQGAPVDLFVEGPTPDWALPLPEPSQADRRPPAAPTRLSPSISTACRPTPTRRARRLPSPPFPAAMPSRSRPISTNSPRYG